MWNNAAITNSQACYELESSAILVSPSTAKRSLRPMDWEGVDQESPFFRTDTFKLDWHGEAKHLQENVFWLDKKQAHVTRYESAEVT